MAQVLLASALWLHALATTIFVGYFLLQALIYVPVLGAEQSLPTAGPLLSRISHRSRVWLYVSILLYIVSGIYLTYVNPQYRGLANFSNAWALLMLAKHILIAIMIILGFWFNAVRRVGPLMSSNSGAPAALGRFRSYVRAMSGLGAAILLLTAVAQVQ
jgi:uncharacterized membrane protein